jgi:CDP-glucose 4,6-dehydratase
MGYFKNIYSGRKVLVTGHTGFKGSWLCAWLKDMGAQVCGYALPPPTSPSHYKLLSPVDVDIVQDLRDVEQLEKAFRSFRPELVFHMAAQPLVRYSYEHARETFDVNVMGTVNVLEACRKTLSIRSVVVITSDKCYENRETSRPYVETDPLGGHDPYSASKGCAEIVTASYRRAFLKDGFLLASVRAGNVIGGGDWAKDRLIPDLMESTFLNKEVAIRQPKAVRPWQHVLDALSGYLFLGQRLLEGDRLFAEAWNFGPDSASVKTVEDVIKKVQVAWPKVRVNMDKTLGHPHEAGLLALDSSKARQYLGWTPVWNIDTAVHKTVVWYEQFYAGQKGMTQKDLKDYVQDAERVGAVWAKGC